MGRRFRARYEKNFFDPTLGTVGSGSTRYIDAMHRDAGKRIKLYKLTERIRPPVNMAGVERMDPARVIHGIHNTDIFKPVTLETLTSRMGIAKTVWESMQEPRDRLNARKLLRARRFTQMHEPFLGDEGPWEE